MPTYTPGEGVCRQISQPVAYRVDTHGQSPWHSALRIIRNHTFFQAHFVLEETNEYSRLMAVK